MDFHYDKIIKQRYFVFMHLSPNFVPRFIKLMAQKRIDFEHIIL
jgi:hypothetical protein